MPQTTSRAPCASHANRVTVIGAGGNIGSHFVSHLGRMFESGSVLLVDHGHYEPSNLNSQAILPRDVGRPKAVVQRGQLRRIAPHLAVEAQLRPVRQIPLGLLAAKCLVACLDSRVSRMQVNEAAWRLGIPWIDTAVDGAGLLARVIVYVPGADTPCLECGWNDDDYKALEQIAPCQTDQIGTAPTNAPASLGAVAAGYAASECAKLLNGDRVHAACSQQVLLDLRHHRHYVTRLQRNPRCRFDHAIWQIIPLPIAPQRSSLFRFRQLLSNVAGAEVLAIRVAGQSFARSRACSSCGRRATGGIVLASRISRRRRTCRACGAPIFPVGYDTVDWLKFETLSPQDWRRNCDSLGLRRGDVITAKTARSEHHWQLEADIGESPAFAADPITSHETDR